MKCRVAWKCKETQGTGHGLWYDDEYLVADWVSYGNEKYPETDRYIEYQKECSHPNCSDVFITEDREQEFCCEDCEELERDMIDDCDVAHNAREEER